MTCEERRERMVQEQLVARGTRDPRVLDAMRRVPRHLFVPEPLRHRAYEDRALPIGSEQTISQPLMVALMLQALALKGHEKVLEVGAGSGYQATLLGILAREVHTIEIIPELAESAKVLLGAHSMANVHLHIGDGSQGWPAAAPYDAIVVAAAVPEVPPPLLKQLANEGKLLIPLGQPPREVLTLIQKKGSEMMKNGLGECAFVPLRGIHGYAGETPSPWIG